ncbi:MAG TPA: Mur ligase domain-containing protein, partial [Candidatus Saccharimonadales bacterium]|nr:Mur ligase domain-containing protein [Candidatus Saccharimonadales bacterium]
MHVFFSGVGGAAIGPLALIAKQAGYEVSGSDAQDSAYVDYLRSKGVDNISIGQSREQIASLHASRPIDWFVYSSALPKTDPGHPELRFAEENHIKATKRSDFINEILSQKDLQLIAVAGTHGKTTATAMAIWLFKQLGIPVSYSVGAKLSFGDMGHYQPGSRYFIYEADEFDRNFLDFHPKMSMITGL